MGAYTPRRIGHTFLQLVLALALVVGLTSIARAFSHQMKAG
jgi:hypothetical protein